jgi:hypothetical protein
MIVGIVAVIVGFPYLYSATDRRLSARRLAGLRAAHQPFYDEEERLRDLLQPLLARVDQSMDQEMGASSSTCPAVEPATQIPVVTRSWLRWLVAGGDERPDHVPYRLNSDAFSYLARTVTPDLGNVEGLERRNVSLRSLSESPYLGVFVDTDIQPVTAEGSTFDGGRVEGWLVIAETGSGSPRCRVEIDSHPFAIIWLRQGNDRLTGDSERRASSDAVARAYWRQLSETLGRIMPGAGPLLPEPYQHLGSGERP